MVPSAASIFDLSAVPPATSFTGLFDALATDIFFGFVATQASRVQAPFTWPTGVVAAAIEHLAATSPGGGTDPLAFDHRLSRQDVLVRLLRHRDVDESVARSVMTIAERNGLHRVSVVLHMRFGEIVQVVRSFLYDPDVAFRRRVFSFLWSSAIKHRIALDQVRQNRAATAARRSASEFIVGRGLGSTPSPSPFSVGSSGRSPEEYFESLSSGAASLSLGATTGVASTPAVSAEAMAMAAMASALNEAERQNITALRDIQSAIRENLGGLLDLDAEEATKLVLALCGDQVETVLSQLASHPEEQLRYLEQLLRAAETARARRQNQDQQQQQQALGFTSGTAVASGGAGVGTGTAAASTVSAGGAGGGGAGTAVAGVGRRRRDDLETSFVSTSSALAGASLVSSSTSSSSSSSESAREPWAALVHWTPKSTLVDFAAKANFEFSTRLLLDYLGLLGRLHPERVYPFLVRHDRSTADFPLSEVLHLVQNELHIGDATAYLLEMTGDWEKALDLVLEDLNVALVKVSRSATEHARMNKIGIRFETLRSRLSARVVDAGGRVGPGGARLVGRAAGGSSSSSSASSSFAGPSMPAIQTAVAEERDEWLSVRDPTRLVSRLVREFRVEQIGQGWDDLEMALGWQTLDRAESAFVEAQRKLRLALEMCKRASTRKDGQQERANELWFTLLHKLEEHRNLARRQRKVPVDHVDLLFQAYQDDAIEHPTRHSEAIAQARTSVAGNMACAAVAVAVTLFLQLTLKELRELVPLNLVLNKILDEDHEHAAYREFQTIIEDMFSASRFECSILRTANQLMLRDIYSITRELHEKRRSFIAGISVRGSGAAGAPSGPGAPGAPGAVAIAAPESESIDRTRRRTTFSATLSPLPAGATGSGGGAGGVGSGAPPSRRLTRMASSTFRMGRAMSTIEGEDGRGASGPGVGAGGGGGLLGSSAPAVSSTLPTRPIERLDAWRAQRAEKASGHSLVAAYRAIVTGSATSASAGSPARAKRTGASLL